MKIKTYQEWVEEIQWLRDKIILPNGERVDKTNLMRKGQMDADLLNKMLMKEYNEYCKRKPYEGFKK